MDDRKTTVPDFAPQHGTPPDGTAERARRFHRLHRAPELLVLPNVWDAGSAVLAAGLPGVRAVATTSAGMAAAHGLPDGEELALDQLLADVAQMTRAVSVPVSVDLEAGYGRTPQDVADSVSSLIEFGVVGVNIEDGRCDDPGRLIHPDVHADRIAAARSAAGQSGVPIVVNARTDVYWRGVGAPEERLDEAVRRLHQYHEAGADCVFLPGFPAQGLPAAERDRLIAELVHRLDGVPVNLLAGPALPSVGELSALGVRRLSVGSALYRLGMAAVLSAAGELLSNGGQDALSGAAELSYPELAGRLGGGRA